MIERLVFIFISLFVIHYRLWPIWTRTKLSFMSGSHRWVFVYIEYNVLGSNPDHKRVTTVSRLILKRHGKVEVFKILFCNFSCLKLMYTVYSNRSNKRDSTFYANKIHFVHLFTNIFTKNRKYHRAIGVLTKIKKLFNFVYNWLNL